ncbi:MAG: undecaprenyl-diphosphate phosphatase [Microcoleaceae cyanobacterium MO_207.B10]|nr:undecaprenyl-diphosphate phosphatase [Microcoleaceae cyanobacterium MO_207.B10]
MKFLSAVTLSTITFVAISLKTVGQSLPSETIATPEPLSQINIFQAIVLGMVQGLTEFLPISSTAHLKVVPVALGWGDPGVAFTAVIQLGSIVSVVWYFWNDLTKITTGAYKSIVKSDYQSPDFKMALGIAFGTLPIVIFGLLIKIFIPDFDNSPLRTTVAIALASIVMALLLGIAERVGSRKRNFEQLDIKDGILMGLAQTLALVPGVSRSGSTITGGLFMGLERATAARFSFLLGLPAITLAGVVELKTLLDDGFGGVGLMPTIAGIISAIFFSYIAIAWLIKYLQTKDTWIFVWYRLAFGVLILMAVTTGMLQNI